MGRNLLKLANKPLAMLIIATLLPLAACAQVSPAAKTNSAAPSTGAAGKSDAALSQLNYLHTDGANIVDSQGNVVKLTGVSWFGMETDTLAPHGLWARNYEEMLDEIVKEGFNTIRLPFSNEMFDSNLTPQGIDFYLNPDLKGLSATEIMDKIVTGAGERGLKVLLDRHRPTAGSQSKLWYTDEVSESQWIADWQFLAKRYLGNDTVIGADLHNEPAGDSTWGTDDPKTDWRLAAERAGNAILDVNPRWLIVVEGIEKSEDNFGNVMGWYWMGGSLQWARVYPVRLKVPNQLVYSAHDYGPNVYEQGWFSDPEYPNNLAGIWDHYWGYLAKNGTAPVLLGEFGGRSVGNDTEGIWQRTLINYLKDSGMSYTYWSFNGNSGDTGGILGDDWKSVDEAKLAMLAGYQDKLLGNKNPNAVDKSAVAGQRPDLRAIKGLHMDTQKAKWTKTLMPELHVANRSLDPMDISNLEMRYWYTADGAAGRYEPGSQSIAIDGVRITGTKQQIDGSKVKAELVADPQGAASVDPIYYVKITFDKGVIVPPRDSLAVKVRVSKKDGTTYFQDNDYSRREYHWYTEWDQVAIYRDGNMIWGMDPYQFKALAKQKEMQREQREKEARKATANDGGWLNLPKLW
ncbi:MAG: cellulase family glycosylhydrolase [Chloroflexi bacterium]|nr:cellulase family glycosylhydrolase [Chloroflexota bacterium]